MIVYAFDPGLASCGFAALDGDARLLDCDVFTSKPDKKRKGDTQSRLVEMLKWAQLCVDERADHYSGDTEIAVVEWPVVGGRKGPSDMGRSLIAGAQIFAAAGALAGMLRSQVVEMYTPVPVSWRCALLGGLTNSEAAHRHIAGLYDVSPYVRKSKAPHALDAVGLALYGLQFYATAAAKRAA